ncbi:hypothetical protein D3C80_1662320 [compost metagenome]
MKAPISHVVFELYRGIGCAVTESANFAVRSVPNKVVSVAITYNFTPLSALFAIMLGLNLLVEKPICQLSAAAVPALPFSRL